MLLTAGADLHVSVGHLLKGRRETESVPTRVAAIILLHNISPVGVVAYLACQLR
jgi:hypothetical protein